ncbi:MAG: bifunctional phosphopantothenoylcysteine decarboxylase/phosphopantothenate--cysteine ligase CoaBC [Acidimicrobiales bacterium]
MTTPLAGRRVVLGVTGGIAAYKAVELCRRMVDAGAHVVPVMTDDAVRFVGEVTMSALASEPVRRSLWDEADPIPHTRLGQGADVIVVAPATARFVSAYASGYSHDLLTATVLATRAPVVVCPAMHTEMWEHAAVQENLATLRRRGTHVVAPGVGRLAGGDEGAGRLAEPESILAVLCAVLAGDTQPGTGDLAGLHVLVSAGGTREPIDPVRVITNRSSGKQGHAIAAAAVARGARVTLVTTTELPVPPGTEVHRVDTAASMERAMLSTAPDADVVVMAAAVADFRPKAPSETKIAKADGLPEIVLEPTPDILSELSRRRRDGQVLVGFAAQTGDVRSAAAAKLDAKRVDVIVANDVAAPGVGFDHDTNEVLIMEADGSCTEVPLTTKEAVAHAVLDAAVRRFGRNSEAFAHTPRRAR